MDARGGGVLGSSLRLARVPHVDAAAGRHDAARLVLRTSLVRTTAARRIRAELWSGWGVIVVRPTAQLRPT